MLFGRVLRAPASPELRSSLVAFDETAARAVPGFVALVRDPALTMLQAEGLGIVGRTPGALDRIEAALAPRWQIDGALRVAEAAGWGAAATPPPAGRRRGRGVACGIYKAMSCAAVVAEVEVDDASGAIRVTRLWCGHDCGLVVNPDQVRAQCEGNLVWGIGMVLSEGLPVTRSQIAAENFADSPIPRLHEVPPMQVILVDGEGLPGLREVDHHEAAAADARRLRLDHVERVGDRDGSIDRVAALFEDARAGLGPVGVGHRHHALAVRRCLCEERDYSRRQAGLCRIGLPLCSAR